VVESLVPHKEKHERLPGQVHPHKKQEMLPGLDQKLTYKALPFSPQYQPKGMVSRSLTKNGVPEAITMANYGGNGSPCNGHSIGRGKSSLKALGLAMFGGFLGLHRFYYEYYASGVLQLLLSLFVLVTHRLVQKAASVRKDKLSNLSCIGQFSLLVYMCCGLATILWWGIDVVLVASQYLIPQDDFCLHTLSLVSHVPTYRG
jgi:hypothetical protein